LARSTLAGFQVNERTNQTRSAADGLAGWLLVINYTMSSECGLVCNYRAMADFNYNAFDKLWRALYEQYLTYYKTLTIYK